MTQMLELASTHRLERRLRARVPASGQRLLQRPERSGFDDLKATWIKGKRDSSLRPPRRSLRIRMCQRGHRRLLVEALVSEVCTKGAAAPLHLGVTACAFCAGYRPIVARYLVEQAADRSVAATLFSDGALMRSFRKNPLA